MVDTKLTYCSNKNKKACVALRDKNVINGQSHPRRKIRKRRNNKNNVCFYSCVLGSMLDDLLQCSTTSLYSSLLVIPTAAAAKHRCIMEVSSSKPNITSIPIPVKVVMKKKLLLLQQPGVVFQQYCCDSVISIIILQYYLLYYSIV